MPRNDLYSLYLYDPKSYKQFILFIPFHSLSFPYAFPLLIPVHYPLFSSINKKETIAPFSPHCLCPKTVQNRVCDDLTHYRPQVEKSPHKASPSVFRPSAYQHILIFCFFPPLTYPLASHIQQRNPHARSNSHTGPRQD